MQAGSDERLAYVRHPDVGNDHADLKTKVAAQQGDDGLGYTEAKAEFVTCVASGKAPTRFELYPMASSSARRAITVARCRR